MFIFVPDVCLAYFLPLSNAACICSEFTSPVTTSFGSSLFTSVIILGFGWVGAFIEPAGSKVVVFVRGLVTLVPNTIFPSMFLN